MNPAADSTTTFKFLDAKVYVRRIRVHPSILLAHDDILKTAVAYYDLTSVTLKIFAFSSGAISLSIDQAVSGHVPKRLLFSMVDNSDVLGANNKPLQISGFRYPYIRDVWERQTGVLPQTSFLYES